MVKNDFIEKLPLDGGVLCLDFVNTVHDRVKQPLKDYLKNSADILCWGKRAGIISGDSFSVLSKKVEAPGIDMQPFYEKALELRELLYGIFYKISHSTPVTPEEIRAFNVFLGSYFNSITVKYQDQKFSESWKWKGEDMNRIPLTVVKSAYELILSGRLDRVKECPNCGWLFLDHTRNGKRKWCSMKSCGSGVKALQYYYRKKKSNK